MRAALHYSRPVTPVLQSLGFVRDKQVVSYGQGYRFLQRTKPEHLRRQGAPQPFARQRRLDFMILSCLFHRIPDRQGQNTTDGMIPESGDELIYVGCRYTGSGCIVHQHPVIVTGKFRDTLEPVQYGMTAFPAARRPDDSGVTGQRQGRPVFIVIRHDHGNALDLRMLAKRQQAVFKDGPVQKLQVLFGFVRAHTPTDTGRRDNSPEIRLSRHGVATGGSGNGSGSKS